MNLFIFVLVGGCTGVAIILASLFGAAISIRCGKSRSWLLCSAQVSLLLSALSPSHCFRRCWRVSHTRRDIRVYETVPTHHPGRSAGDVFLQPLRSRSPGSRQYPLRPLLPDDRGCRQCRTDLRPGCADGVGHYRRSLGDRVFSGTFSPALYAYIRKKTTVSCADTRGHAVRWSAVEKTIIFASLSAMHQSSLYIGKILVQGAVNLLGTASIAAYTATTRIEGLSLAFGESGSESISVFIARTREPEKKNARSRGSAKGCSCSSRSESRQRAFSISPRSSPSRCSSGRTRRRRSRRESPTCGSSASFMSLATQAARS